MFEYDFAEKLAYSKGVSAKTHPDTILNLIPGCVKVEPTALKDDLSGIDFFAYLRRGAVIGIDIKTRVPGCSKFWKGDSELALEDWSAIPTKSNPKGKTGWTLDEAKLTDYTLHVFDSTDTDDVYLLPFQLLRMAFRKQIKTWLSAYKHAKQDNGKWVSHCVFVPANVVIDAIQAEMRAVQIRNTESDINASCLIAEPIDLVPAVQKRFEW